MAPKKSKTIKKIETKKVKDKKIKPAKLNKQNKPKKPGSQRTFLMGGQGGSELLIQPSPALESKLFRVRRWGDPVMAPLGFDVNVVNTTNFQAVGLYNKETGFGAVTNFIHILRADIDNLRDMQFTQVVDGRKFNQKQKTDWLCSFRGKIYMYDEQLDDWEKAKRIRWGTLALGGNLVQVGGFENFKVKLPGEDQTREHKMARLVGFRKTDWSRPLDELLAEGLVHRCYCAYKNNQFGDSPKGIVYSPFYSLLDWDFAGAKQPRALYIPFEYLEPKEA